jgi:hypothetical protein
MDTETTKLIIKRAQNIRALATLSATEATADEYQMLLNQKSKFPHDFEPWQYPSFWTRGLPLKANIDAPMHLVFLGAVQGVTGFIHTWLRKHDKFANFMRLVECRLNCFVKFKLDWLKMLP